MTINDTSTRKISASRATADRHLPGTNHNQTGVLAMTESIIRICGNCRYFSKNDILGTCRRFPQSVSKHHNDWCGCFKTIRSEIEEVALEMVNSVSEGTVKRRGRPRKVAI